MQYQYMNTTSLTAQSLRQLDMAQSELYKAHGRSLTDRQWLRAYQTLENARAYLYAHPVDQLWQ